MSSTILRLAVADRDPGLLIWLARYSEQAFSEHIAYHTSKILGLASSLLWVWNQASYSNVANHSSAYPLASLGHANWILRNFGYKLVFIWGLCLYGLGALIAWPCIVHRSFGGFCAAIFVIGNGLGSLETAANPYITGQCRTNSHDQPSNNVQSAGLLDMQSCGSTLLKPSMASALLLLQFWEVMFSFSTLAMMLSRSRTCNGSISPLPVLSSPSP